MGRDFQPRNMADLRKASAEKFSGSGIFVYSSKLEKDKPFHFRLLPGTPSMGGVDCFNAVIYNLGFGKEGSGMLMSPQTFGVPRAKCPIEQELAIAAQSTDPSVKALLDNIKRGSQIYCNIVPLEDGKASGDPKVLVGPYSIANQLNEQWLQNPELKDVDITHPSQGYGVKLKRSVTNNRPVYTIIIDRGSSELSESYYREIRDIPAMLKEKQKSDEELRSAVRAYLYGETDEHAEPKQTAQQQGFKREPVTPKPTSKVSLPETQEEVDAMTRSQILLILGHPDYKADAEQELGPLDEATVPSIRNYLKTLVPAAKPARPSAKSLEDDLNKSLSEL